MAEPDQRTVADLFQRDHEEVVRLLEGLGPASSDGPALARAERFSRRLERHMAWEEEVLFPALGRADPRLERDGLPALRAEHARLRGLCAALLGRLRRDSPGAEALVSELRALLSDHASREYSLVQPQSDGVLSAADVGRILAAVAVSISFGTL